jgi:hypothetical protein
LSVGTVSVKGRPPSRPRPLQDKRVVDVAYSNRCNPIGIQLV